MTPPGPRPVRFADLGPRLASGVALAAIAAAALWAGGLWAAALVATLLLLMTWELHTMVAAPAAAPLPPLLVAAAAGLAVVGAAFASGPPAALAALAAGTAAVAIVGRPRAAWLGAGFLYMGLAMGALVILRGRGEEGALLILWLVLIVIAADVGAYFAGRVLGGPKLWVRVSPGKTWSGAIGGLVAAVAVGIAFALAVGWPPAGLALLSLGIAIFSQLGDLLESAVKRHFGVKDASNLIPGHGGVMDRLDGITGGIWFFALCEAMGVGAIGH